MKTRPTPLGLVEIPLAKVPEPVTPTDVDEAPYTLTQPPGPHAEAGDVVRRLRRSWWIIILCGIIALAVGYGVSRKAANSYQATTYVLLNSSDFQQAVAGGYTAANSQTQEATAISLLTPAREMRAAQAAGLSPAATYSVSVNASSNSNVLNVNGTTANPRTAAALANAAAQQMIDVVKQSNANTLKGARAAVQSQLRAAKPSQKQTLAAELNSFATLQALANQSMQVIQPALVPGVSSGSSKKRDAGIALVLGLILGTAIALLRPPRTDRT